VFGVLALTGLAAGQTTTPLVPASTGDAEGQIVTVQEMGKAAQKCKVLKTWTEPDGTHAYQVQALDTGELMTIEGGQPNGVSARSGPLRAAAMRIFHWGRRGDALPPGTPLPPTDAVVVNPPADGRPLAMQPPPLTAVPAPADNTEHKLSGRCPCLPPTMAKAAPSPYVPGLNPGPATVMKVDSSPYAPGSNVPPAVPFTPTVTAVPTRTDGDGTCQCAPPVVTRVEPIPYSPVPVVGVPASGNPFAAGTHGKGEWKTTPSTPDVAWGPEIILPPPPDGPTPMKGGCVSCGPTSYDIAPVPASIAAAPARTSPFKFWNPLTWRAKPTGAAGPNATANAGAKTPTDGAAKTATDAGHKTPPVVAKVEVTPAQPGDWRESWGKIEPSKSPAAKTDLPAPPTAAAAPTHPNLLPIPTAMTPAKNPGLMPPASDAPPSSRPALPSSPTVAAPPKYPGSLPPAPVAVKPTRPDATPPVASATPARPTLPPSPAALAAAGKDVLPHAQKSADDPLKDPEKYTKVPRPDGSFGPPDGPAKTKTSLFGLLPSKQTPPAKDADKKADASAKPAVPPGMKSALAAVTPGATSGAGAALGFDPNEPNAFSDPKTKAPSAPNAFTEPPPPPDPQAVALAGNAFVNTDGPQPPGAPTRGVLDTGLPTRYLTVPPAYPLPAPAAPRPVSPAASRPAPAVVPAGYRPGNPYDLTPMVAVLRESLYPSQREEAAEQLGAMDWRRQPEVVDILVERAREDPAPTVRAECVRSLGRMKANTLPAVEAVKFLQSDEDVRVRHEAEDAYAVLTGTAPKAAEPADASSPQ